MLLSVLSFYIVYFFIFHTKYFLISVKVCIIMFTFHIVENSDFTERNIFFARIYHIKIMDKIVLLTQTNRLRPFMITSFQKLLWLIFKSILVFPYSHYLFLFFLVLCIHILSRPRRYIFTSMKAKNE